ncbi:hypothetical protein SAMN02982918_0125, partial [Saccharomonospora viridis]
GLLGLLAPLSGLLSAVRVWLSRLAGLRWVCHAFPFLGRACGFGLR